MHRGVRAGATALVGFLLALAGPAATAEEARMVRVENPWSRATPPGTDVGAGYFELVNEGTQADRLVDAESPRAGRVMIHRTIEEEGTTRMEHQHEGVLVPPGARVTFAPGGYHLMLMRLSAPLEKGERVPVTLHFRRAGEVAIELEVRGLGAGPPD